MSSKFRKRGGANQTGRSKYPETFVMLMKHLLQSDAYRSLKPIPRAVYTELRRRYNGRNNGEISCSVREIAAEVHCSKDSASAAFDELQAKGFIKQSRPASFHYKVRHAPTWILTEENYGTELPTKEYLRWRAIEKNDGPKKRTFGPKNRTPVPKEGPKSGVSVPNQGPCRVDKPSSRS
jgi:hypothetical protein